jgi:hypothetical protein
MEKVLNSGTSQSWLGKICTLQSWFLYEYIPVA